MGGIVVIVGAILTLLSCGGVARAGAAGVDSPLSRAALLGRQGFAEEFINAGTVQETAPILLAKKRKSSKKKKSSGTEGVSGGGGTIQIDPNTAKLEELMLLPLINREEAESIIKYRKTNRIDTPEEMLEIAGIEPSKYRIFKHLIVIREEAGPGEIQAATSTPQLGAAGESKPAAEGQVKENKEAPPPPPQKPEEPQPPHKD